MALAGQIADGHILYLRASVMHSRRGSVKHSFRYDVDYILLSPEAAPAGPKLFSQNRFNLFSWHRRDHGGQRGHGTGPDWAWKVFTDAGIIRKSGMVLGLLTQPRFLGFGFNPVSFWLLWDNEALVAAIAEVNNTFGQRHSYLCARPDFAPVTASTAVVTQKIFHVSPFQDVSGEYRFGFSLHEDRIAIRIRQLDGANGLEATMSGPVSILTSGTIMRAALRRPGGALRVVALIYWNALRLKLKGVAYRPVPAPPDREIS